MHSIFEQLSSFDLTELTQLHADLESVLAFHDKEFLFEIPAVLDTFGSLPKLQDGCIDKEEMVKMAFPDISKFCNSITAVLREIMDGLGELLNGDDFNDQFCYLITQQQMTVEVLDLMFAKLKLIREITDLVYLQKGGQLDLDFITVGGLLLCVKESLITNEEVKADPKNKESMDKFIQAALQKPKDDLRLSAHPSSKMQELLNGKIAPFYEVIQAFEAYETDEVVKLRELLAKKSENIFRTFCFKKHDNQKVGMNDSITAHEDELVCLQEIVASIDQFIEKKAEKVTEADQEILAFIEKDKSLGKLLDRCRFAVEGKTIAENKALPADERAGALKNLVDRDMSKLKVHRSYFFMRIIYAILRVTSSYGRTNGVKLAQDQLLPQIGKIQENVHSFFSRHNTPQTSPRRIGGAESKNDLDSLVSPSNRGNRVSQ